MAENIIGGCGGTSYPAVTIEYDGIDGVVVIVNIPVSFKKSDY